MISVKIFDTPIRIKLVFLVNIIVLWGAVTWYGLYKHPERSFLYGLFVGLLAMILLMIADIGHAIAHIFSARFASVPMDEILISAGMPRTLYSNNKILPSAHRMRAIGGPIFSGLGLLLSMAIHGIMPRDSLGGELAVWSLVGNGFILAGSLLPLPMVDGGTILKWTLVEKGKTEAEADAILRRVNWVIGITGGVVGIGLIIGKIWIAGLVCVGVGGISIAAAIGKVR
jgi:hypothetical protein